jgi:ABC-type methionine transport system permease subunit
VTDAQTWTVIGTFIGAEGAIVALTLRAIRAEIRALRAVLVGEFRVLAARFDTIEREGL